ncbi:MAG: acyltransferase [Clostridia bacterium]|nr:acyltransferase [Clostridia bacterium]
MISNNKLDPKYIDVLDGIRALSVIIVLIFHFWQQTWIFPNIRTPFLRFLKIESIDFTNLATMGYLFVDMLVLLSGFLLFLPVMRQVFLDDSRLDVRLYIKKRIARILPSYYFAVLFVFFVFALPSGQYASKEIAYKDLITHLTFTQTLFVQTHLQTKCGAVLWTVAVEVWFYIIFPFIARLIEKRDCLTKQKSIITSISIIMMLFISMHLITVYWDKAFVNRPNAYVAMYINQLPAFMGTYANGMLGAMLYVLAVMYLDRSRAVSIVATILSVLCLFYIITLIKDCERLPANGKQFWQVSKRWLWTGSFTVFILSSAMSARWFRALLSNPVMRFLSRISFNLYIWHQWLAVQIKYEWRIPAWTGEVPPNQTGDRVWMNKYALIITAAAFIVATLFTYLIERPASDIILGKRTFVFKKSSKTQ